MSGFFHETDYVATGLANVNIHRASDRYCAGCNGGCRLIVTSTSVTGANGVFGAGFDVTAGTSYVAFVTFGDTSTAEFGLPGVGNFWEITSQLETRSIHLGLAGGASTTGGYLEIDNLSVGNAAAIPEPAVWSLSGVGMLALGALRRGRSGWLDARGGRGNRRGTRGGVRCVTPVADRAADGGLPSG